MPRACASHASPPRAMLCPRLVIAQRFWLVVEQLFVQCAAAGPFKRRLIQHVKTVSHCLVNRLVRARKCAGHTWIHGALPMSGNRVGCAPNTCRGLVRIPGPGTCQHTLTSASANLDCRWTWPLPVAELPRKLSIAEKMPVSVAIRISKQCDLGSVGPHDQCSLASQHQFHLATARGVSLGVLFLSKTHILSQWLCEILTRLSQGYQPHNTAGFGLPGVSHACPAVLARLGGTFVVDAEGAGYHLRSEDRRPYITASDRTGHSEKCCVFVCH